MQQLKKLEYFIQSLRFFITIFYKNHLVKWKSNTSFSKSQSCEEKLSQPFLG